MNQLTAVLLFSATLAAASGQWVNQCVQGRFGTDTGTYFDNWEAYKAGGNLTGIRVYHAEFIYGIEMQFGGVWTGAFGDSSINPALSTFFMSGTPSDSIRKIEVKHGRYIDQITFRLNNGVVYGPYGGHGGGVLESVIPVCGHVYFKGRTGAFLDILSIYTDCTWCQG